MSSLFKLGRATRAAVSVFDGAGTSKDAHRAVAYAVRAARASRGAYLGALRSIGYKGARAGCGLRYARWLVYLWAARGRLGPRAGRSCLDHVGTEAGQIAIEGSFGMAVDQQSGDVYVSDAGNNRIDEFDGSGEFMLAWGWGVIPPGEGSERANELQVCTSTTGCGVGIGGRALVSPTKVIFSGVAVDNEPGALHGDVYVVEFGDFRVQEFDSKGRFLRMFGGHVNRNGADVCVAGEATECQVGTLGEGDSEFEWPRRKGGYRCGSWWECVCG